MTDAISIALAVLAVGLQGLLALLALVAIAAIRWRPARTVLREVRETLLGGELWAAWAVALVATLGSLYYSEIADFVPCRLCWFQRIAMYPLAILLLGIAIRRDVRNGFWYAIWFPVLGLLVSLRHIYVEIHPESESQACRAGVSCATKWIEELGYVTIPVLAGTAFATIIVLLLFARSRLPRGRTPTTA
jgi:disulfide bond formation protein DsbB